MNRCDYSYNTVEDPFGRMSISNKVENVNLKAFDLIKGINESKTLARLNEFDARKCNSSQKWNNGKCQCECKKP